MSGDTDVRDPAFLDVMLTVVTDQVKQQHTTGDQLNSRATAIAATAGASLALLATTTRQTPQHVVSTWAVSIGAALFFAVLASSYLLWRVRAWQMDPKPDAFWEYHRGEELAVAKHQLVLNVLHSHEANNVNLDRKLRWLRVAVAVLLAQLLYTTAALIALPHIIR
jgi:hypothetical protein